MNTDRNVRLFRPNIKGEVVFEIEITIPKDVPTPDIIRYYNRFYIQADSNSEYAGEYVFAPVVVYVGVPDDEGKTITDKTIVELPGKIN